jgi:hypothetical protein
MLFKKKKKKNTIQQPASRSSGRGEGDNAHWPACGMHSPADEGVEEHNGLACSGVKTG